MELNVFGNGAVIAGFSYAVATGAIPLEGRSLRWMGSAKNLFAPMFLLTIHNVAFAALKTLREKLIEKYPAREREVIVLQHLLSISSAVAAVGLVPLNNVAIAILVLALFMETVHLENQEKSFVEKADIIGWSIESLKSVGRRFAAGAF